jgi:glycosyltransferase involved in cell wall biosynthesis
VVLAGTLIWRPEFHYSFMSQQPGSILYISYPMLPVTAASCGGAEQILWSLEREMHQRGWQTTAACCEGSQISGELYATGDVPTKNDRFEERDAEHCEAIFRWLGFREFDLIHDKSGRFWKHAHKVRTPILATLHLPRSFYDEALFRHIGANVHFNCVSETQAETFRDLPRMMGVVRNGIDPARFPFTNEKRDYLLWLGRICPEKGTHLAIEAAEETGLPLVIAGSVYPFSYHQEYFEREVRPRFQGSQGRVVFVEAPSFEEKVRLLQHARALVQTSLAPETSSLVAMEAMACGTPVVALRAGAIPEVVAHGETGFVVRSLKELVGAIHDVDHIWPWACRSRVEENFTVAMMADGYENLYREVLAESSQALEIAA